MDSAFPALSLTLSYPVALWIGNSLDQRFSMAKRLYGPRQVEPARGEASEGPSTDQPFCCRPRRLLVFMVGGTTLEEAKLIQSFSTAVPSRWQARTLPACRPLKLKHWAVLLQPCRCCWAARSCSALPHLDRCWPQEPPRLDRLDVDAARGWLLAYCDARRSELSQPADRPSADVGLVMMKRQRRPAPTLRMQAALSNSPQ